MKVLMLPSSQPNLDGPYMRPLVDGLAKYTIELADMTDWLSGGWLLANRGRVPVIHLHWTAYHYAWGNFRESARALASFLSRLTLARLLGYRIVWTFHNYMPHERPYPILHYLERFALSHLADRIIVHCERGRQLLGTRMLRFRGIVTIPLGVFPDSAPGISRVDARNQLDIDDQKVVLLFFGSVRPYKGVTVPGKRRWQWHVLCC